MDRQLAFQSLRRLALHHALLERGIALISYASANLHFSDKKKILKNRRKAVSLFIGILPPNASRTGTEGARPMDIQDIAKEVLPVIGTGRQITPFSKADPDFSLNEAYRVSAPYARREKRAESARLAARSGSPAGPSGRNMASMRRSGLRLRPHRARPHERAA
jgi:hypothetical protein